MKRLLKFSPMKGVPSFSIPQIQVISRYQEITRYTSMTKSGDIRFALLRLNLSLAITTAQPLPDARLSFVFVHTIRLLCAVPTRRRGSWYKLLRPGRATNMMHKFLYFSVV